MNSVLLATLAGVITATCWGAGDWLVGRISKKFNKFEINFMFQIPSVLIMIPILLVAGKPLPNTTQILTLGLVSLLFTCAFLLFIKALSSGSVGIVVPLANTYSLLTLVLSIIFIGSVFTSLQVVAILAIVGGAVLLAYEKNHQDVPLRVLHKETFFALGAATTWGVAFFLINTVVGDVSWQMITGITSMGMMILAFAVLAVVNKAKTVQAIKSALAIKMAFVAGIIGQVGAMSLYFGSERSGSVIIPVVLASGAPLVASGLSAVVDTEKLGLVKRIGAVVVVAGIIILNLV